MRSTDATAPTPSTMLPTLPLVVALLRTAGVGTPVPAPDSVPLPTIPVERFTLPNGLTVLLSRDTTAPVVSVTVWYHVGSKNERPGRTGFAHLFEHVMFQGSEHAAKGVHIKTIEDAGGTMNGTTNNDRTEYFETVPENYLATVLWLESDRMGYLLSRADAGEAGQPARRREERAAVSGRQPAVRSSRRGHSTGRCSLRPTRTPGP